jgi:hypothetical protein
MTGIPATQISSGFNIGRGAIALGAAAAGGATALGLMKASDDNKGPSRGVALGTSLGLGSAAVLGGLYLMGGNRGMDAVTNTVTTMGRIGGAMVAAGAGAAILGSIGAIAMPSKSGEVVDPDPDPDPVDPPTPGPVNPPTPGPVNPPTPGPTPGPAPDVSKKFDAISGDASVQSLTVGERALLASVATQEKASVKDTLAVYNALANDEYLATVTTPSERGILTSAALEAKSNAADGYSATEQAVATMANTDYYLWVEDASLPDGGAYAVEDSASRVKLAAAGLRGLATGEDSANKYLNIAAGLPDLTEAQNVELASAALEGQMLGSEAVEMFTAIDADSSLSALSDDAKVALAAGALRGGKSAEDASAGMSAVAGDYPGEVLTADEQASLVGTALEAGLTGDDAVLTYVNLASNEAVYEGTSEQQKLEIANAALRGYKTGEDAASAFNAVTADTGAAGSAPVEDQVRLAAASLQGDSAASVVTGAYNNIPTPDGKERVLMASAQAGGLDTGPPSPLIEWYLGSE